jgi:hypothetical protein
MPNYGTEYVPYIEQGNVKQREMLFKWALQTALLLRSVYS